MRFKGLDLNLLVAFDTLMETRNVSRAAERLGLSQPATSAALARLRDYFRDELLVVHGKRMYATPFAESLLPQVHACLQTADAVVATTATFDPASSHRTFKIIASDYVTAAVLAPLVHRLSEAAPNIDLHFTMPDDAEIDQLTRGEVDLMITPFEFTTPTQPSELLFEETQVIAGWEKNSIFRDGVTEQAIFARGHVAVSIGGSRTMTFGDRQLDLMGRTRRIEVVAASFTVLPWLLMNTERLAVMHERLAIATARHFPIRWAKLPFTFPTMRQMVQFHHTRKDDEGLRWLIDEVRAVSAVQAPIQKTDRLRSKE